MRCFVRACAARAQQHAPAYPSSCCPLPFLSPGPHHALYPVGKSVLSPISPCTMHCQPPCRRSALCAIHYRQRCAVAHHCAIHCPPHAVRLHHALRTGTGAKSVLPHNVPCAMHCRTLCGSSAPCAMAAGKSVLLHIVSCVMHCQPHAVGLHNAPNTAGSSPALHSAACRSTREVTCFRTSGPAAAATCMQPSSCPADSSQ